MFPIKFKRIEIRKPRYDPHPEKSLTNNSNWRQGLFIVFEDYNGNEFDYMPKWGEIALINEKKIEVEILNKELCKKREGDYNG